MWWRWTVVAVMALSLAACVNPPTAPKSSSTKVAPRAMTDEIARQIDQRKFAEAAEQACSAIGQYASSSMLHFLCGIALYGESRDTEGQEMLRRAVELPAPAQRATMLAL